MTIKLRMLAITALFSLLFTACSKDDIVSTINLTVVNNSLPDGNWRISHYTDSGTDKTALFTGHLFTFNSNGSLVVTAGIVNTSGTWGTRTDSGKPKMDITFPGTAPAHLQSISEDWEITSASGNEIKLQHVSGGGSGVDYITLTKN